MGLTRRHFLQRSGLVLTALGSGDLVLSPIAQRYQRVLAAPTRRKLALLIGINQYRPLPLYGCVTDVELQRELLVHRFGFQPSDILTLTDQQATRGAIVTAFTEHLIEQAQAGDVVVFHFSGYGGRVALGPTPATMQKSLVTIDEPTLQGAVPIVNDLLADTLLLLLRSLLTDRVTTILDTSYTQSPQPLQGNLRLRSRPGAAAQLSEASLAFQEALLSHTKLDRSRLSAQRRSGQMPGVLLTAAGIDQGATESRWSGFSAGLFTYAMTQQLWQATPATVLRVILRRATEQIAPVQQPQLSGQNSRERPLTPYYLPTVPTWGADGVVERFEANGKAVRLWLGGLAPAILEQYEANAMLTLVPEAGDDRPPPQLQIVSRDGLIAKAKLHPPLAANPALIETMPGPRVGQFVREQVRVLPRTIGLTIAIDSGLARIERVDAISAISAVPHLTAAIAGEQAADYLFSKTHASQMQASQTQPVPPATVAALPSAALPDLLAQAAIMPSSYALFSLGGTVIPHTAGEGGEAVKVAVKRLVPKLQTLLAAKWLNLTVNEDASQLAVRATLAVLTPLERRVMQRETPAIAQLTPLPQTLAPVLAPETAQLVSLPIGSPIQYRLENQSDRSLYWLLLYVDSAGAIVSLDFPPALPATSTPVPTPEGTIASHETLTVPQVATSFQGLVSGPTGLATTYVLCSRAPFKQTMTLLNATRSPAAPALQPLAKPLEVVQALLQDLHQASDRATPTPGTLPDSLALDMRAWASFRFRYQIV